MINKYTFFDVETTGISRHFSQIISIYAKTINIDTGEIIDELKEECCLRSYLLPSPEALIINKFPPAKIISLLAIAKYEFLLFFKNKSA